MSKKIFRLHNGGVTKQTGWFKSSAITPQQLNSIKTDGKDVATSIPTPFASIDLVKSAFSWVAKNDLDGKTAQHKLVSYALDIGQLFFTYPRYTEELTIVAYNPIDRFKNLKTERNKQRKYIETLELFWNQDKAYNFDKTNRLFFLLNKQTNEILGSTSPSSLFMSAPDVESASKNINIQIGQHKLLDDSYAPLFNRDKSYILYLYTLSKQSNFPQNFPEFYQYLEKVKQELSADIIKSITDVTAPMINDYDPCPVLDNEGNPCEVLGIKLGVQGAEKVNSDFEIKPDFDIDEKSPLILPQYPFAKDWNYVTGVKWDKNTKIPYKNKESVSESRLPVQNIPYYWLSVGNFLEDKIFKLPYPIDNTKFKTCGSKKHLLPLTPNYFKYFDSADIDKNLTVKERSGGNVEVELKISVKAGDIIFKKQYSEANNNIEELPIHLAIFPFLRSNDFNISHNIGLLDDRLEKSSDITIGCMRHGLQKVIDSPITRNPGLDGELVSKYYTTDSQPDSIYLESKSKTAFLVPLLKEFSGKAEINFAIDFGTTNTHIEYQKGENVSRAFESTTSLPLLQTLLDSKAKDVDLLIKRNEKVFEQEVLPKVISQSSQTSFPLRTAIVYNKDIDFNKKVEVIREVNNYLLKEEEPLRKDYLKIETDIKWSNYSSTAEEKKVESYIEFLTMIAYYKTLQLGGSPENTSITWFYPVSMDEGEREVFFNLWKKIFSKVFSGTPTDKINGIPESVAPYLYYKSAVAGLSLSIDIGGGSSDIAVFDEDDKNAKMISSFKFAGNAIFGDGYPSKELAADTEKNGFVKTFQDIAYNALNALGENDTILKGILNNTKKSADFSSYLFALEQKDEKNFSYSSELRKNNRLKLSMLVFYASIAYYSANLLKKSNIKIPKYLLLSGTASKTSAILDPSENLKNLSYLFQFIFEHVFGKNSEQDLEVKLSEIPKEVTCKGALKAQIDDSIKNIPIRFWIGGTNDNIWNQALDRDKDFKEIPKYSELNNIHKEEIENSIKDFYKVLDLYTNDVNIKSRYLLDPTAYDLFKEMREKDIKDYLTKGINAYHKRNDSKIEESLFFYPLIGVLNKLSFQLAEKKE